MENSWEHTSGPHEPKEIKSPQNILTYFIIDKENNICQGINMKKTHNILQDF